MCTLHRRSLNPQAALCCDCDAIVTRIFVPSIAVVSRAQPTISRYDCGGDGSRREWCRLSSCAVDTFRFRSFWALLSCVRDLVANLRCSKKLTLNFNSSVYRLNACRRRSPQSITKPSTTHTQVETPRSITKQVRFAKHAKILDSHSKQSPVSLHVRRAIGRNWRSHDTRRRLSFFFWRLF